MTDFAKVIECFGQMQSCTEDVLAQITEKNYLPGPSCSSAIALYGPARLTGVSQLEVALRDIWLHGGEDARTTRMYQGVIIATPALMRAIERLNQSKSSLQHAINAVKAAGDDSAAGIKRKIALNIEARRKLNPLGFGMLNFNACFRKVLAQPHRVESLSYTNPCKDKSISVITAIEAYRKLESKFDEPSQAVKMQLLALGSLPPATPVALVQHLKPRVKANLVFQPNDDLAQPLRKTVKPGLPIAVPAPGPRRIKFAGADRAWQNTRLCRSDQRLAQDPVAPAICAYLYVDTPG